MQGRGTVSETPERCECWCHEHGCVQEPVISDDDGFDADAPGDLLAAWRRWVKRGLIAEWPQWRAQIVYQAFCAAWAPPPQHRPGTPAIQPGTGCDPVDRGSLARAVAAENMAVLADLLAQVRARDGV